MIPARYIFTFFASAGLAILYGLKVNLSVAIVAMVNHTGLAETTHDDGSHGQANVTYACPAQGPSNSTNTSEQIELLRLVKDILLPSHIATKKKGKVKKAGLNKDSEGSIKNKGNKKPEKKKKSAKISKKLGSISSFHSSVSSHGSVSSIGSVSSDSTSVSSVSSNKGSE
ncbi:hypothetical protein QYM36_004370, partial [Artemia franciscana]